jgi:quinol monooxygenase YgiN
MPRACATCAGTPGDFMQVTRLFVLGCAIALTSIGCSSKSSNTEESSEPQESAGQEAMEPSSPAPIAEAPPAGPAATPAPAAPAAAPAPQMPPLSALVTHKVKDYAAWKTVFDTDEQARKDAGMVGHCLMRDVKKPNTVTIWAPYSDQAKIDGLMGSDAMKAKMKEGGVQGKPTIVPLKHVSMSPPTESKQPKFGAIVTQTVKDFDAWKTGFEAGDQMRKDAGITGYAVSQDPKDAKIVTVWLEADDQAKLEEFMKSKDLKAKMKEAGVVGAPKVTVYEILEFKMYNG